MTERNILDMLYAARFDDEWDAYEVKDWIDANGAPFGFVRGAYKVTDGATKVCIIPKDLPFVVKWSYNTDSSTADEAYEEVRIYNAAVEKGLADFFPDTSLFCEIDGIKFVRQDKISISSCDAKYEPNLFLKLKNVGKNASDKIVDKMQEQFDKTSGHNRVVSRVWAKAALVIYGKRKCKELCKFIVENDINDLHDSNTGYIGKRPIILDFSGYHRND